MARQQFKWECLPDHLLRAIAEDLGMAPSSAASHLANVYGTAPGEDFVREFWEVLREDWLSHADGSRQALVAKLWELGVGYADEYPVGHHDEMAFLRTCNNARRLREVALGELTRCAEEGSEEQPVTEPQADNRRVTTTAPGPSQHGEIIRNHAAFIWSVADLLRGDYKQSEYGKVILPLTVIRRLDCVLEPTKQAVLDKHRQLAGRIENMEPVLQAVARQQFYNTSPLTFTKLLDDPDTIADSLQLYIGGFSGMARDVIEKFDFGVQIERLRRGNLLYKAVGKFAEIDLHPDVVSNIEMGYLYEELIRKFSELSNETAGEHFTPREVIRLMVNLLFIDDEDVLTKPGIVKTLCDPACLPGAPPMGACGVKRA